MTGTKELLVAAATAVLTSTGLAANDEGLVQELVKAGVQGRYWRVAPQPRKGSS